MKRADFKNFDGEILFMNFHMALMPQVSSALYSELAFHPRCNHPGFALFGIFSFRPIV